MTPPQDCEPVAGRPGRALMDYRIEVITLPVSDVDRAKRFYTEQTGRELTARGLAVSPLRHKASTDDWQGDYAPGVDRLRRDYASLIDFADPDGNTWIVQERGFNGS